jgi:hypothetical protein
MWRKLIFYRDISLSYTHLFPLTLQCDAGFATFRVRIYSMYCRVRRIAGKRWIGLAARKIAGKMPALRLQARRDGSLLFVFQI